MNRRALYSLVAVAISISSLVIAQQLPKGIGIGVYYKGANDLSKMDVIPKPSYKSGGVFNPIGPAQRIAVIQGDEAPLQISEPRPTFYISGLPTSMRDIKILSLSKKKGHREIQTKQLGKSNAVF